MRWICFLVMTLVTAPLAAAAETLRHEIVVYGGTAGGVIAAVAAAREGADVALVVRGEHLGGLVTSGLGATDAGRTDTVGGYTREFFTRLGAHYGQKGAIWRHEPSAAERIFEQMVDEANVTVYRSQRLRLDESAVEKQGTKIIAFETEAGTRFAADVFLDATYEGDLLALAGVDHHIGRESRDTYGEKYAGVRPLISTSSPGAAHDEHGLLPDIVSGPVGETGDGDHKLQAYCFRLCLTQDAGNRVPITKPDDYDPRRYTLLLRTIEGRSDITYDRLLSIGRTPGGKTDVNNVGSTSTDLVNGSWDWPEADYDRRQEIWEDHRSYIHGLLWFLANEPRVPEQVRREAQQWGFAKDEFVDNDHWPRELYVREARRMVGEHVMTEHDLLTQITKPDSIGMGSYMMDVHYVQRTLIEGDAYILEGPLGAGPVLPYEISMRSLVPRREQASNLLVPVCMSASHVAWSSLRMEPVFMIMGHAAGVMAALAAEQGAAVQDVAYEPVRQKLQAHDQVLHYTIPGRIDIADLPGTVIDESEATYTGFWSKSSSGEPFVGQGYRHDNNHDKGRRTATYHFDPPQTGRYEVRMIVPDSSNRAPRVPVTVRHADGETTVHIDQSSPAPGGEPHHVLGVFRFEAGAGGAVVVSNEGTTGFVVTDAMQFLPVAAGAAAASPNEPLSSDAPADRTAAIDHVRRLVLACQLDDGGLRMQGAGDTVRIIPYFSNYAALGLLASHEVSPDPAAIEGARRWIQWYVEHQEPDGTMNDHTGTVGDYHRTDHRDSTDSYAATYLMLLERCRQVAGDEVIDAAIIASAKGAMQAIEDVWNADGLTWAKPDYKVKYLMDNVEVNMGLTAAADLFEAVGESALAQRARKLRQENSKGLTEYWQPEHGYWAWAKGSSGGMHTGFDRWYPHCVITLFTLAYVMDPPQALWDRTHAGFGDTFEKTPDYWTLAAWNVAPEAQRQDYARRMIIAAGEMTLESRQLNRLGWALLAMTPDEAPLPEVEIGP